MRRARKLCAIKHDRSGERTHFTGKTDRVGFQEQRARSRDDLILVFLPTLRPGYEDFPIAIAAHAHGVTSTIPKVEVTDNTYPLSVGCPHHEGDASDALHRHRMCA